MKLDALKKNIARLYRLLSPKHKLYLCLLIILTIGFSLIEMAGISAIMPFISLASNPALLDAGWYKKAFDLLNFTEPKSFIFAFGAGIVVFYFFRAFYSIGLTWLINRYPRALHVHLSGTLFKTILAMPYRLYAEKNSADLIQIIGGATNTLGTLVLNVLQLCVELFTVALVYTLMLVINWQITIVLTGILLVIVLGITHILLEKNKSLGKKQTDATIGASRILREVFGNFKFVRLRGNEETILRDYGALITRAGRAEAVSNTLGLMPKSILESIGFSLLVGAVMFILWFYDDASRIIPLISMYALALYRILPAVHRLLQNLNNIAYSQYALKIVDGAMHQSIEHEGNAPIAFEKSIRLEQISFSYATGGVILKNISLEIARGERVAVTGESGSGKSTLIDLIIGIHKPDSGFLYLDGAQVTPENVRSWRGKIGYIPQSIYLFDGTVAENVTFGSQHDEARLRTVLEMANIWEFLADKDGIHTRVGEEGIQLSGGQQQRIGIARALYHDPDVLVLDEATSALDTETEAKIMDEIYSVSKNKTLIVIAHRLSTVERCDRRIRIENGGIVL
ncbi:MAG: ABC transporter ATP-binding protein [Spirochaetaceae bacterium]|jgi:ATP-binding cassette subfamily B protein/ATP-binding cassette subfamily C protein|nr:ABC transporter ATP-binding protein [Spirochaetaceae bacterium]